MKTLSILIVEDEPIYADLLEMHLLKNGYKVAYKAHTAQEARTFFAQHTADMALVDVNLGGDDGIELVEALQQIRSLPVIFITSLDDDTVFERTRSTQPYAYMVKPVSERALIRAIELAIQRSADVPDQDFPEGEGILLKDSFFIKDRNKLHRVREEEILWISVEERYCIIHLANQKFMVRMSLKELAERLDTQLFVRTHRNVLVSVNQIEYVDLSDFTIKIHGQELPLGKVYKDHIMARLRLL